MKALVLTALVAGAALAACSSGDSTTPTTPADIAGTWDMAGTISNASVQTSCNFAGTVTINQAGSQATGTYSSSTTCTGPGGTVTQPSTGNVGGGKITGNAVSFNDDGGCKYVGTVSGNPTNAMNGTVSCIIGISGTNYTFAGTWNANR
jgi:hypothetical protein